MKRLISICLVFVMLVTLTACKSNKSEGDTSSEPISDNQVKTENTLCTGAPENSASMLHVFDALIMALTETGQPYDAEDSKAFWTELPYLIGEDGNLSSKATKDHDGNLVLPSDAVKEFAAAMFASFKAKDDLPEIPDSDFMMVYDKQEDTYTLKPGDFGDTETKVVRCKDEGDDVYTVTVDFISTEDQSILSSWEIVMTKTRYQDGEGLYHYQVADIQNLTDQTDSEKEESDDQNKNENEGHDYITVDDAVSILYNIKPDVLNLNYSLDDCFISPDGSTDKIDGHECYIIPVYKDSTKKDLLNSYYVQTDGQCVYVYNDVTDEYNEIS